jgi:hypothetical protein
VSRRILAAIIAALALAVSGCAAPAQSRLAEYHRVADHYMAETVARIPAPLVAEVTFSESEPRFESSLPVVSANDPAWWHVYRVIELTDRADAAADAASIIDAALVDDGWVASRVRETEGGARLSDGYRAEREGGRWYIEVTWTRTQPDRVEVIEITVVSPSTVRGDGGG